MLHKGVNYATTGSDNGLAHFQHQAISSTTADLVSTRPYRKTIRWNLNQNIFL